MGTLQLVGTQPQLEKQSVSVLLLEDSAFDAALISEQLQLVFLLHDFQRVDNRADFIAALHVHEWDLILADMNLPDFDGIAALQLAAELAPEVPFIFVSATIGEELAIESMKRGATDYVLKQRLSRLSLVAGRAVTAHLARDLLVGVRDVGRDGLQGSDPHAREPPVTCAAVRRT